MNQTPRITGDTLTNALYALGVHFILGGGSRREDLHTQPSRLIAALAESDESRLRLSLIPLFLEHPEFSAYVQVAAEILNRIRADHTPMLLQRSRVAWTDGLHAARFPARSLLQRSELAPHR